MQLDLSTFASSRYAVAAQETLSSLHLVNLVNKHYKASHRYAAKPLDLGMAVAKCNNYSSVPSLPIDHEASSSEFRHGFVACDTRCSWWCFVPCPFSYRAQAPSPNLLIYPCHPTPPACVSCRRVSLTCSQLNHHHTVIASLSVHFRQQTR